MTATGERVKCVCGMPMLPTAGSDPAMHCPNCDEVQAQEPFSLSRMKTKWDIRFDMHWLRIIESEYTDNTQDAEPEVGTANSDNGEDTPNETEGDTNG